MNFLLLRNPAEELAAHTPLADFGMDSLLAAEFRASMFNAFKIEVPLAVLMDRSTKVMDLARMLSDEVENWYNSKAEKKKREEEQE